MHLRWHYVFKISWGKLQRLNFTSSVPCILTWRSQ